MDWARYKELEREEREFKRVNPITVEVTIEDFESWKFGMMLLRRVAGNTKDPDLATVDNRLSPLLGRMLAEWNAMPEARALIDERMRMLEERNQEGRLGS